MRPVNETSAALRALDRLLVDKEDAMTDQERESLTAAVFRAIAPEPASISKARVTFNGETRSIREWSKRLGINYYTLFNRLKRGWGIGMALTRPTKSRTRRNHKEK